MMPVLTWIPIETPPVRDGAYLVRWRDRRAALIEWRDGRWIWPDGHPVFLNRAYGADAWCGLAFNPDAAAEYARANPLGGPASVFEAAAERIRSGEPLDEVMQDYALQWVPKP